MTVAASAVSTKIGGGQPTRSLSDTLIEVHDIGIVSGDTSATATAKGLHTVDYAILVAGVVQTAVPTFSTNVATFTFTDPVATVKGHVIMFGK